MQITQLKSEIKRIETEKKDLKQRKETRVENLQKEARNERLEKRKRIEIITLSSDEEEEEEVEILEEEIIFNKNRKYKKFKHSN
jgi:hypothetical protein